ncbi:retrovirus-related pol polyprotein from transposon TNT 1-94 [Tanacetum coccineum]
MMRGKFMNKVGFYSRAGKGICEVGLWEDLAGNSVGRLLGVDILSVQATSVASKSAFSTSGRVLSIQRTRVTPASSEMCVQEHEAIALLDEEVALDEAASEARSSRGEEIYDMTLSESDKISMYYVLIDSGANERPLMLERGNYIPWESRFKRFMDNKLEDGERMWNSIKNGPYKRPMSPNPDNDHQTILKPLSKMTKGNKKQYISDVKVMNYLLQAIPNDIYNSVDAGKNAKDMWERIKKLMFGSDVTSHIRHSRLMNEFDKFTAKEGESLESVNERLTTFVNIMDRNNVRPIPVSINTKFLNCLHPEWSKYVTMFEPHVLASKAKKDAKNHDPLSLLVHSNASLSQSHANSSYSPQPYYVTHPSSVVDYEDEYQGELQGDSSRRQAYNCHDVISSSNHSEVLHTYK